MTEERRHNDVLLKELKFRLYGENWDKGDIPLIRDQLKAINGHLNTLYSRSNKHRLWLVALTIIILGGGSGWLVKLLE